MSQSSYNDISQLCSIQLKPSQNGETSSESKLTNVSNSSWSQFFHRFSQLLIFSVITYIFFYAQTFYFPII